jgi:hypothetical protein
MLEVHNKNIFIFLGAFLSILGWFLWNILLSVLYPTSDGTYLVKDSFLKKFGRDLIWWATVLVTLMAVVTLELVVNAMRRVYWPHDQDFMQRIERDQGVSSIFREHALELGESTPHGPNAKDSEHVNGTQDGDRRSVAESTPSITDPPVSARSWDHPRLAQQSPPFNAVEQGNQPRRWDEQYGSDWPLGSGEQNKSAPLQGSSNWVGMQNRDFVTSPIELQSPPGRNRLRHSRR